MVVVSLIFNIEILYGFKLKISNLTGGSTYKGGTMNLLFFLFFIMVLFYYAPFWALGIMVVIGIALHLFLSEE